MTKIVLYKKDLFDKMLNIPILYWGNGGKR